MDKPYPYLKVILGFALLGGTLGGLLLAVFFIAQSEYWRSPWRFDEVLIAFAGGALCGMLPALLTGAWLAWQRVLRNRRGMLHTAIAGAVFFALGALGVVAFIWLLTEDSWLLPPLLPLLALITPTGTVSALLFSWALLPKAVAEEAHA